MLKKLLFSLVTPAAALAVISATAQTPDFRVVVHSAGEPVGYAYVMINENVHAMTDAGGTTTIRASRLYPGDILSARFVGMESVPVVWDEKTPPGSTIELELIPNRIEDVVVTARSRDRSKRLFRKYVERVHTHGWYAGFRGDYDVRLHGKTSWTAVGKYKREHVPGEDLNSLDANTFTLHPAPGSEEALSWQVQRYLLTVKGIAERAVQFEESWDSNRGMILRYRGNAGGQNIFLIIKPYFDRLSGLGDSFQTLIYVSETSGVIRSSETVSQNRYGIWNVSATYATYSPTGRSADRFIYPTQIRATFEERSLLADIEKEPSTVEVAIDNITAYHFTPATMTPPEEEK